MTKINGKTIKSTAELVSVLRKQRAQWRVVIERGGKSMSVVVTL